MPGEKKTFPASERDGSVFHFRDDFQDVFLACVCEENADPQVGLWKEISLSALMNQSLAVTRGK